MWGRMCPITRLSQVTANATPPPPSSAPHCPRASTGATAQDFNSITAYDMCPSRRERCPLTIDIMRPYMGIVEVKAMLGQEIQHLPVCIHVGFNRCNDSRLFIQLQMDMSIFHIIVKTGETLQELWGLSPSHRCVLSTPLSSRKLWVNNLPSYILALIATILLDSN